KMRRLPYRLRSSDCSIYFLEPPQQLFALTLIGRILLMIPPRIPSTSRNRRTWLMCYLLPDPRVDRRELLSSIAAPQLSFDGHRPFSHLQWLPARCSRLPVLRPRRVRDICSTQHGGQGHHGGERFVPAKASPRSHVGQHCPLRDCRTGGCESYPGFRASSEPGGRSDFHGPCAADLCQHESAKG